MAYPSPIADPAKPMHEEPAQAEIDGAWRDEIRRRAAELDAGRVRLADGGQVFAELRQLIDDYRG